MKSRNGGGYGSEHFLCRELSWLEFNQRVLDEAVNPQNPIFEKINFLCIAATNLDEFFMVRVASIRDQVDAGYDLPDSSGLAPKRQLEAVHARAKKMMKRIYEVFRKEILPELGAAGLRFADIRSLSEESAAWLSEYFDSTAYPVLTPMAVDAARPFPLILNRSLNLGILLEGEGEGGEPLFATVQVPSVLSRVIRLPSSGGEDIILLEQAIAAHIGRLFGGRGVICCHPYRITRNADLTINEEGAEDLLKVVEESLRRRRWGQAVRLEIDHRADERLVGALTLALEIEPDEVYPVHGPINLGFLSRELSRLGERAAYRYPPFSPRQLTLAEGESIFDRVDRGDVLLYHPYDSFDPVIGLIRQAARDPRVLAIKQTLYRVSSGSPILNALIEAAESGKQVTALLELKARFDEENNIHWGRRLERAGAHVIYGILGLKTHSKITLIVRQSDAGIKRYVHLSTGNYNEVTARVYTDHSLITANDPIGRDASAFFNMLTGLTEPPKYAKLVSAPGDLRGAFVRLIRREARIAAEGGEAEIFAKMNSLVDEEIIKELYSASAAGVRIRLLVRGICCLRPGIPGVSDGIAVRSIVGRFLEHSRVFLFRAGGEREAYLSSADWMPRNMDRRVELLFPVEDPAAKARLASLLKLQWRDSEQSRELRPDGSYAKPPSDGAKVNSQEILLRGGEEWRI